MALSNNAKSFILKLNSFYSLRNNWDSYGAKKPKTKNIKKAIKLVKKADKDKLPIYFTAPGPNGEVVVMFKKGKLEASIFFNEDGTDEVIIRRGRKYLLESNLKNYNQMVELFNSKT